MDPETPRKKGALPSEELRCISGTQPHKSWKDWRELLGSLPLISEVEGVMVLGDKDCTVVVFPNGCLHHTTNEYAHMLLEEVRVTGAMNTLRSLKTARMRIREALGRVNKRMGLG